jgi:hypothetical protein
MKLHFDPDYMKSLHSALLTFVAQQENCSTVDQIHDLQMQSVFCTTFLVCLNVVAAHDVCLLSLESSK